MPNDCWNHMTITATADELAALTGLIPGAVPPFGEPILPLSLTADPEVGAMHGRVAFNAGTREDSVIMSTEDWKSAAQPTFAPIAAGYPNPIAPSPAEVMNERGLLNL